LFDMSCCVTRGLAHDTTGILGVLGHVAFHRCARALDVMVPCCRWSSAGGLAHHGFDRQVASPNRAASFSPAG
jgi:hypothetical protein